MKPQLLHRIEYFRSWTLVQCASLLLVGLFAASTVRAAQAEIQSDKTRLEALSGMTLEELLITQVTSVSKRPEKWFETSAAVHVITGEEVRRSGVRSITDALRLSP